MDLELEMTWKQLEGWARSLAEHAHRARTGEPAADPSDKVPPREKIGRLVKDIGVIYGQIVDQEATVPTA